jgi:hypothetical protein
VTASKKTGRQLDTEIVEAITTPSRLFRVQLTQDLARAVQSRGGSAVFFALQRTPRGYTFESSDPGTVRAFWIALTDVHYRPSKSPSGQAISEAATAKRNELQALITRLWPEALSE